MVRVTFFVFLTFFFFKQKTAYEITVRDWSSDVCSSDLSALEQHPDVVALAPGRAVRVAEDRGEIASRGVHLHRLGERCEDGVRELGDEEPDGARWLDPTGRDVEELAHRPLDTVAGRGANRRRAACDARRGRDANS